MVDQVASHYAGCRRRRKEAMEQRSSRRMRELVTQIALRGLSANQIECALTSVMARSA
jgi:hypothetical protein